MNTIPGITGKASNSNSHQRRESAISAISAYAKRKKHCVFTWGRFLRRKAPVLLKLDAWPLLPINILTGISKYGAAVRCCVGDTRADKKIRKPGRIFAATRCNCKPANAQLGCRLAAHRLLGFPLLLWEAMTAGSAIVGYKSCNAIANIIEDGENRFAG